MLHILFDIKNISLRILLHLSVHWLNRNVT